MATPLISIIVPVYNTEKYIMTCIDSLVNQSYRNIEIILVDDGSKDSSPQLCDTLAKMDERVRCIHKKNGGVSSARNTGVRAAKGEYIGFVDSDDWVSRDMYSILLKGFEQNPSLGLVQCRCFRADNESVSTFEYWSWAISAPEVIKSTDYVDALMYDKFMTSVCCFLFKSNLLKSISFIEDRNNEDGRFFYDIADAIEDMKLDMYRLTDKLYYYRATPHSIYYTPKVPLEIDIVKNLEEVKLYWENRRPQYVGMLDEKIAALLIILNQKIQTNAGWRALYADIYRDRLRGITNLYVIKHFGNKRRSAFFILKYAPVLYRLSWINKFLTE